MAISSLLPTTTAAGHRHKYREAEDDRPNHRHSLAKKKKPAEASKPPSSWEQFKSLLTCRSLAPSQVHDPSAAPKPSRLAASCSDLCSFRDVADSSTLVVRRRPDDCTAHLLPPPPQHHAPRVTPLMKLSGCYECRAISEPNRYPIPRTICRCPDCGEVFTRTENLEIHQTIRHAVSELGPEDSSRNIVEIIFKSSWTRKELAFRIERILKVHNTQRTVARFEGYREAVKSRAALHLLQQARPAGKDPRCAADGNELLRFHCAGVWCALGSRGSTSLCGAHGCGVCGILRHGFGKAAPEQDKQVGTTSSSGRAHERCAEAAAGRRRAMLVCRVIAGRVRARVADSVEDDGCDSVSTPANDGGAMEELFVANPRAILPCFVVVYRTVEAP